MTLMVLPAGAAVSPAYGCKNRPPVDDLQFIQVQDGYNDDGTRRMIDHLPEWKRIPCGHTERAQDSRCSGCKWRKT